MAIEYKESPFFTMYVDSGNNALGIFSNCPVDRILDVKLLILFNSSTVVLLAMATEYKVSPFWPIIKDLSKTKVIFVANGV